MPPVRIVVVDPLTTLADLRSQIPEMVRVLHHFGADDSDGASDLDTVDAWLTAGGIADDRFLEVLADEVWANADGEVNVEVVWEPSRARRAEDEPINR